MTEGQLVRKDLKVLPVTTVQGGLQDLWVHWDLLDQVVKRENRDPKDQPDLQDPGEFLVQGVILDPLVEWDLLDHLVLMDNLESRGSLESPVRRETLALQGLRACPVPMGLLDQSVLLD